LLKTPKGAILAAQTPGIGRMSIKLVGGGVGGAIVTVIVELIKNALTGQKVE
jgi:hypothetical protein